MSTRAANPSPRTETHFISQSNPTRSTQSLLEKLIKSASNSECECLKNIHDDIDCDVPENQSRITDFFQTKFSKKVKKNNVQECRNLSQLEYPKIKYRLKLLLKLCKGYHCTTADSESIEINCSVNIKNKFLQRIKFSTEMLPSMPFLSTNSETSLPVPESVNESLTKLIHNEKELPDNGKDNVASKRVSFLNYGSLYV